MADNSLVSFVVPAFNESRFIEDVLERLDSTMNDHGLKHEVVVVDDGSVDDTRLRALKYAAKNDHVVVIGYDKNIGKGFAVKAGFQRAVGDAIVFVDSDSDVDVGQVKLYVDALRDGDVVIGSKWHPSSVVEVSFVRRLLSHGFGVLVRLLTGIKIRDTQAGIKAVRRKAFVDVFKVLSVNRYAFDVELLVFAKILGLKVIELPVKLKLEKVFSFREVWHMLLDLLGITYRLRVRKSYRGIL